MMGEDYKKDLGKLVSDSATSAIYKVFVEHHKKDVDGNTIPHEGEEINEEEKKYKVRESLTKKQIIPKRMGDSF